MTHLPIHGFNCYWVIATFVLSISLNAYLFFQSRIPTNETITTPSPEWFPHKCVSSEQGRIHSKRADIPKTLSIFIKPHPPNFLEGRRITFSDFEVTKVDGATFVTFSEIQDGMVVKTTVDSEAIQWK